SVPALSRVCLLAVAASTGSFTLSLHDALPIFWPTEAKLRPSDVRAGMVLGSIEMLRRGVTTSAEMYFHAEQMAEAVLTTGARARSEEHTSELQSRENLVCRLLLEKKKRKDNTE